MGELAGKTALVTGAGKRLGRAVALALSDNGANVVAHYRTSATEAEQLCAQVTARGVRAWALPADLADPQAAEELLGRARAVAGDIHLLINNASVFEPARLAEMTFAQMTQNAAVNAWAPFALSRAFAAQGLGGHIVNLLDAGVSRHMPGHAPYILSKHVLLELTRMCALEYAPRVAVNAVAPGFVLRPDDSDPDTWSRLAGRVPMRRQGDPRDVVEATLFLLRSEFITGQVIYVDGGAHLQTGR